MRVTHGIKTPLDVDFDDPAPSHFHQRLSDRFQGEMR
jgi:hypothetical protein